MRNFFFISFFFTSEILLAQNFVPNYSFEEKDTCPYTYSQIYFAIPWFQPNIINDPNYNSSDYYDSCSTNSYSSVPLNNWGSQSAKSGSAYVGICGTWALENVREYIEVELIDTLKGGSKYCAKFYLSLSDKCNVGINKMGMYFSTDSIIDTSGTGKVLPYIPQVYKTDTNYFYNDKNNWMELSGVFTAQGGEKFLTIGNFDDDAHTDTNYFGGGLYNFAYYYIDDVSVTLCDTTGVKEKGKNFAFAEIYPNPNNGNMQLKYRIENTDKAILKIYDVNGKLLLKQMLLSENTLFEITNFTFGNGIYYYSVTINGEPTINKKLVVIQ